MLFNSSTFLFLFLPLVWGGFVLCSRLPARNLAYAWLLVASLVFYSWANFTALALLLPIVVINFFLGTTLSRPHFSYAKLLLWAGVCLNLFILGYFKYANFFIDNLNALLQADFFLARMILPLGISFVTFMQIAWLVSSYRKTSAPCTFFEFMLYSTFFPQVVSGPIAYEKEIVPQFRIQRDSQERSADFCIGATLFTMGLAKKVLIADTIAPWATQVFWAAEAGRPLSLVAAWIGALAYTFQLYYDFSGYSDMAIGVARIFGIRLPLNFNSPYCSGSITEFWRRWHMTLSRFLRDYLYISLGGSRCGSFRRSLNLFLTMLLGGFWHGAGWTFLMWGALHGVYLIINHSWTSWREKRGHADAQRGLFWTWNARLLTFLAVMVAWIFFRAKQFSEGCVILAGMTGWDSLIRHDDPFFYKSAPVLRAFLENFGVVAEPQIIMIGGLGLLFIAVWFFPNSQQLLADYAPGLVTYGKRVEPHPWAAWGVIWKPNFFWILLTAVVFLWSLLNMSNVSSFLYRDF